MSLPGGPGSLEGLGANASPDLNMGLMNYSVDFELPEGHANNSPALALSYSSSGGQSVAGFGWGLSVPSIERRTSQGLPLYDSGDVFVADGGSELVRVPGTAIFRSRYEQGFVRYEWREEGDGSEGYWIAEYPDGRVGYFGADREGRIEENARVMGPEGTFRYHLVESVDTVGTVVRYEYEADGSYRLLRQVRWVDGASDTPRYVVDLGYEAREDVISTGRPGFDLRMGSRLREVTLRVQGEILRRWVLSYQPMDRAFQFTRLAAVQEFGRGGQVPFDAAYRFAYSDETGGDCLVLRGCGAGPVLVEMGSVGGDFRTGELDFIDLNGDGLPDVVNTREGRHRIHVNELRADGTHRFRAPVTSARAGSGSAVLSSAQVQVVDLNGDGFSDMIDGANNRVLWNGGQGDWIAVENGVEVHLPDFENTANLRFFDWNGNGRSDVLYSDPFNTWVYENLGDGRFDDDAILLEPLGVGFEEDAIQLADMNGDGLADVVQVTAEGVRYRLNLGWGRFSDWIEMTNVPDLRDAEPNLVDLDGDGLSDVVVVSGTQVAFSRNRNGRSFAPTEVIDRVDGELLPERGPGVEVRFADMNGNGSTDVVWITASGRVTYLDLAPQRRHLLSRTDNGMGRVTEARYATSAEMMALDGGPENWQWRLPNPMVVVHEMIERTAFSEIEAIQRFRYRDGFYDGMESQFRGFAEVEVTSPGDASIEALRTSWRFENGAVDPYRFGLLLESTTYSDDRPLRSREQTFEDCAVEGVPAGVEPPVRFLCRTRVDEIHQEGRPESEWVRTRTDIEFDGFGNVVRTNERGVTTIGGQGCAPCDRSAEIFGKPCAANCRGDERYTDIEYIHPDTVGRWMIRLPYLERRYGVDGAEVAYERRYYYDGEAFEGLALGQAERGLVSRVMARRSLEDADDWVPVERHRYDAFGNSVEELGPRGFSRRYEYDEQGVHVRAEVLQVDADRWLRMEFSYDPVLDLVVEATHWMLVEGGRTTSRRSTLIRYDDFGRRIEMVQPGDPVDAPNEVFQYRISSEGVHEVRVLQRSVQGGRLDREQIRCFDGGGRAMQRRTRLEGNRYYVEGFFAWNRHGQPMRRYESWVGEGAACETSAPAGVPWREEFYDADGRTLEMIEPDASAHGGRASVFRYAYLPLEKHSWDPRQVAGESDGVVRLLRDGLGRTTSIVREGATDSTPIRYDITYDALGKVRSVVDSGGFERFQQYDLLGNLLRVDDPNSGWREWERDDEGNTLRFTDASGAEIEYAYDGIGRQLERWESVDRDATLIRFVYDAPEACDPAFCTNAAGRVVEAWWPWREPWDEARDFYGYDGRGRTARFERALDGVPYTFTNTHDNLDNVTERTFPDGRRLTYTYDRLDRLRAIGDVVSSISYDDNGLLRAWELGNGNATLMAYDTRQQVRRLQVVNRVGDSLLDRRFSRDRNGNILAISDDVEGIASASFTYDEHDRLLHALLRPGTAAEEELRWSYDALDNLLAAVSSRGDASPAHIGPMTYGENAGPRALTRAAGVEYLYDDLGRLARRGPDRFTWDAQGRVETVSRGEEIVARYGYGPDEGRLLRSGEDGRTLQVLDDYEIRHGIAAITVSLADQVVARLESAAFAHVAYGDPAPAVADGAGLRPVGDGRLSAADAWLAHASRNGAAALQGPTGDPREMLQASVNARLLGDQQRERYFHGDHLNSRVLTTDASGEVIERTWYYPFGQQESLQRMSSAPEPVFAGGRVDEDAGLVYFGARYLDPRVGRWISPDPQFLILDDSSFNSIGEFLEVYSYARNNPVHRVDPSGRSSDVVESLRDVASRSGARASGNESAAPAPASSYRVSFRGLQEPAVSQRRDMLETKGPSLGNLKLFYRKADGSAAAISSDSVFIWQKHARTQPKVSVKSYNAVFGKDTTAKIADKLNIGSAVATRASELANAIRGGNVAEIAMTALVGAYKTVRGINSRLGSASNEAKPTTRPRSNAVVGDSARPNLGRGSWQSASPSSSTEGSVSSGGDSGPEIGGHRGGGGDAGGDAGGGTRPRSNAVVGGAPPAAQQPSAPQPAAPAAAAPQPQGGQ